MAKMINKIDIMQGAVNRAPVVTTAPEAVEKLFLMANHSPASQCHRILPTSGGCNAENHIQLRKLLVPFAVTMSYIILVIAY